MEKKYKAQVSVEMLVLVGIVVLGGIIFATFYLSSVNKNIDQATNLDVDLTNTVGSTDSGSFPVFDNDNGNGGGGTGSSVCGDNTVTGLEQCDPSGSTESCTNLSASYTGGTATCSSTCSWDLSSCIGSSTCDDGVFDSFTEVCDFDTSSGSYLYNSSYDCSTNPDYINGTVGPYILGGDITCSSCGIDYSGCQYATSRLEGFILIVDPPQTSANINIPSSTNTSIDFNGSVWVDVNVFVEIYDYFIGDNLFSDKCKYDGVNIPADENGIFLHRFNSSNPTEEYIKDISCSENGIYTFKYNGVDNNGNTSFDEVIFTVPQEGTPIFALCKEQTNSNGSFNVCINYFTEAITNSNGSAIFFINHPDVSEYLSNSPICTTNSNGSACFSLGFT